MKALQSVGQIIGEVLKQLDHDRCEFCRGIARFHSLGNMNGFLRFHD